VALVSSFRLCNTRLLVERAPGVRPWTSYIVVSNHQSMFDIPILGALLFSNFPKYVSKRELGRGIPSVSYNLRRGACADRPRGRPRGGGGDRRARPAGTGGSRVGDDLSEGTRARRGELGAFRRAGS